MSRLISRPAPSQGFPANATQAFILSTPKDTHMRQASCKETDCPQHLKGWMTIVPTISAQADYIRSRSRRHFREERSADGIVTFHFGPGQECFRPHYTKLDKEAHYLYKAGHDTRRQEPIEWVDNVHEEMYKLNKERE